MSIYTIPHYVLTEDNKDDIKYNLTISSHDDKRIKFSDAVNQNSPFPITYDHTWDEMKCFFADYVSAKNSKPTIKAIFACSFIDDAQTKSHKAALDRYWLTLDFDEMGCDANYIFAILKKYVFIAFTSYNSMIPSKGNSLRLKVWLPLKTPVPLADWGDSKTEGAENGWIRDGIVDPITNMGFTGANTWDKSSRTFGHYQAAPSLNPATTYLDASGEPQMDLWINDGAGTEFIDVYDLAGPKPTLAQAAQSTTKATAKAAKAALTTIAKTGYTETETDIVVKAKSLDPIWRKNLADILITKPFLTALTYSAPKGYSYKILAIGLVKMLFTFAEFKPVYDHMVSGRASKPSHDALDTYNIAVAEVKKLSKLSWGLVIKVLSIDDKIKLELVKKDAPLVEYKSQIANESTGWVVDYGTEDSPYLDISKIPTKAKAVIIYAPPGSGKTYGYQSLAPNVRIAVPSTGIRKQAGSDNNIMEDIVVTYEQASKAPNSLARKCVLMIDECHQLGLMDFRMNAYKSLAEVLKKPWKQIVFASATHAPQQWDKLITALPIGITPADVFKYKFNPYYSTSVEYKSITLGAKTATNSGVGINEAIVERCKAAYDAGVPFIVINDNTIDNDSIIKTLEFIDIKTDSIKSALSDHVGSETNNLLSNTNYKLSDNGLAGIVSTRIACEGINIRDEAPTARVIVVGQLPYEFVYQASGRFRNIRNVTVEHICPGNTLGVGTSLLEIQCIASIAARKQFVDSLGASAKTIGLKALERMLAIDYADGVSVMRNFVRDGYTYDESAESTISSHPFAECITYSLLENNKFYKGKDFRNARMIGYGCTIGESIHVDHTQISVLRADSKKSKSMVMTAIKGGSIGVLRGIKNWEDNCGGSVKDLHDAVTAKEFVGWEHAPIVMAVCAATQSPLVSDETVKGMVKRVIDQKIDIESIQFLADLAIHPVIGKIYTAFPIGSFVSTAQQNIILTDIYNHSVNTVMKQQKITKHAAEKIVKGRGKMFEKIDFDVIGNCISTRPAETLRVNGIMSLSGSCKGKRDPATGVQPRGCLVEA